MTFENLHEWINQLTILDEQTPLAISKWHKLYSDELLEKAVELGYSRYLTMIAIKVNKGTEYESIPTIIENLYQMQLTDNDYFQNIQQLLVLLEEKEEELKKRSEILSQTLWKCASCRKEQPNMIYLPCGHIIHCKNCVENQSVPICTACKLIIEESCTIYI